VSEITNEDIDAVTDPEVCALADAIVLGNQGCGNASVLIDRFATKVRQAARERAIDEAAEVADAGWVPSYVMIPKDGLKDDWQPGSPWDRGADETAKRIASQIRKLKEG